MAAGEAEMSFWDHLEVLRGTLFRSVLVITLVSVVVFCFKSLVFDDIILAPTKSDFFIYKWLRMGNMQMSLVNLDISAQFFVHLQVAFELGFILSFPYVCFEIWKFIAPALYRNEKRAVRGAFLSASFLFYLGLVIGYYLIVPISLNFFISMFTSTVLAFGIVFEFPIVVVILSKLGIVTRNTLIKYRRHAIVVILCIAAIITPADPMSMLIAAAPLLILYEVCVMCCKPARPEDALEEIKEEA